MTHATADRHADRIAQTLPERPRGRLDTGCQPVLGMAGRLRMQLAKAPQLVQRQVVAGQVQQRIQQHRTVPVGEHETVTIGPLRISRIMPEDSIPERYGDVRHAHRHSRVPGARLLDRVDRQHADRIGHPAAAPASRSGLRVCILDGGIGRGDIRRSDLTSRGRNRFHGRSHRRRILQGK